MATRKPVEEGPPLPTREQWADWCKGQKLLDPNWVQPEQLCVEDFEDWKYAKDKLDEYKELEMKWRNKIYRNLFREPSEGANNIQLADGRKITATRVISRKPDEALIDNMSKLTVGQMREYLTNLKIDVSSYDDDVLVVQALGLRLDELFKWKPELVTGDYRKLTPEQLILVDSLLEIKDGSPQLKMVTKASE